MQGRRRLWRALALVVGLLFAVAATATLVLTEDIRWLQLAVIAALWAFLIAAFVAGQRRPEAAVAAPGTDVELAPRREIELLTEVRLRREIESTLRDELGAVRAELQRVREDTARLRHDILERWDGELHVERIAVRAESTRYSAVGSTIAALQDEARRLQDGSQRRPVLAAPTVRDEPDAASTVEFSVVPPAPATPIVPAPERALDETGPVYGVRPTAPATVAPATPLPVEESATTVFPRIRDDHPAPAMTSAPPATGRHGADGTNGSVDAAALLRRLEGEAGAVDAPRRRRRARDDDAPNDVPARLIGERTG